MSWLNFNDSLNSLKGQISNLAQTVLAEDDEDSTTVCKDCEELKKICIQRQLEIENLKQINGDLRKEAIEASSKNEKWNWVNDEEVDGNSISENNSKEILELKKQIEELKNENRDLVSQLELLDSDNQKNYTKLIDIKDKLQDELESVKEENDKLYKQYHLSISKEESLVNDISGLQKKLREYENAIGENGDFKEKYCNLLRQFKTESKDDIVLKLSEQYQSYVNTLENAIVELKTIINQENLDGFSVKINNVIEQLGSFKNHIGKILAGQNSNGIDSSEDLESIIDELRRENDNLLKQIEELQENHKTEIQNRHGKYMKAIEEIVEQLNTFESVPEFNYDLDESDSQILELRKQMEYVYKMFLDMKSQILDLSKEKTSIMAEKNQQIQKLMETSDALSKEVIQKSFLLKEYEKEIKELEKNNELILIELEAYKTTPLETISESNEDKVVLLEEELETANVTISSLNKTIEDIQKSSSNEETEYTSSLEEKVKETNNSYSELLDRFDKLQIDYDFLKSDLETAKEELKFANEEYLSLKSLSETSKINNDNVQQELNETKVNNILLRDDLKLYKDKVEVLLKQIEKLQIAHDENLDILKKELDVYKESLTAEDERNRRLEETIENLTEKLRNAKMAETSLKLQYDTLGKEVLNLSTSKSELESSMHKTNTQLIQAQNECDKLQNINIQLKEDYDKLQAVVTEQEEQLRNSQNMVSNLREELSNRNQEMELQNKEESEKLKIILAVQEEELGNSQKMISDLKEELLKYKEMVNTQLEDYGKLKLLVADQEEQLRNSQHTISNLREDLLNSAEEKNKNLTDNHKATMNNNNIEESAAVTEYEALKLKFEEVMTENSRLKTELSCLQNNSKEVSEKYENLKRELEELSNSRNEMINVITVKHQENVAYHAEIQRLMQMITTENERNKNLEAQLNELKNISIDSKNLQDKIEKLTDENNFLKEKCAILTDNLLKEQVKTEQLLLDKSNSSEEQALKKKLERLQQHLIEVEEHYTQELLQAEEKNKALQFQVNEMEKREKSSSTMYTSVNIRANQQVESLQNQLQVVAGERDSLRKQISDSEDVINKQAAALTNLQLVLEQFRKDKEKEVHKETERIRRHINAQKQREEELNKEILSLKSQLQESKQGLLAASRLSDQLEHSKKTINALKQEVSQLQVELEKKEEELNNSKTQTDGKVDKFLLKNLFIGFVSCNNNLNKDQYQILRIIATVLDFSQADHEKVNLDKKSQGSWLSSLLTPQPTDQSVPQESLSKAFIEFLEKESKPTVVPSLLNVNPDPTKPNSRSSTPKGQSPANLSEIVLPTFSDFGQNRNSSSILKDVLKHN